MTEPILNSVDELLDEIRRLREENERARELLKESAEIFFAEHFTKFGKEIRAFLSKT